MPHKPVDYAVVVAGKHSLTTAQDGLQIEFRIFVAMWVGFDSLDDHVLLEHMGWDSWEVVEEILEVGAEAEEGTLGFLRWDCGLFLWVEGCTKNHYNLTTMGGFYGKWGSWKWTSRNVM